MSGTFIEKKIEYIYLHVVALKAQKNIWGTFKIMHVGDKWERQISQLDIEYKNEYISEELLEA